jgi:hypothetical protein
VELNTVGHAVSYRKDMPSESGTGAPEAKTKEQIEADFKRRHKLGLELRKLRELKGGAVKEDSTDTKSGK